MGWPIFPDPHQVRFEVGLVTMLISVVRYEKRGDIRTVALKKIWAIFGRTLPGWTIKIIKGFNLNINKEMMSFRR